MIIIDNQHNGDKCAIMKIVSYFIIIIIIISGRLFRDYVTGMFAYICLKSLKERERIK